jgi:adenylate kinase
MEKNILLLGPPGSGKGTQGARLAAHLGVEHLAVGDLLRAEIRSDSVLGRALRATVEAGELVPDDVVLELISSRAAALAGSGYVLDGFPRSVAQAERGRDISATAAAVPGVVLNLDVPEDVVVQRLLARSAIEGRADDNEATIRNRLQVFTQTTAPLLDHYAKQGKLRTIDASGAPDEVFAEILKVLGQAQ